MDAVGSPSAPNPPNPSAGRSAPEPKITVTRAVAARTKHFSRMTVRMIGDASKAGGASRSGLTRLIWLNVVQTGGDGMVAVALANTIFFSAATSQQRSNVALYLLITMAPFALVAPVIGPLLDRMQHGRRVALAGTMVGRGLLAWIIAANFHSFALYPAVFGFLVISKAFNVLKGACVPRVLPGALTLVSANARLSIFGLAGGALFGGLAAGIAKVGGSPWTLRVATLVFLVAAVLALHLPRHVDSSVGETRVRLAPTTGPGRGKKRWRQRSLGRHVVTALRGAAALRGLSGFLTLFLVFLVQHDYHGFEAVVALSAVAIAAGGGSFLGTAAGARLRLGRPDVTVVACVGAATAMCVVTALTFSIEIAVVAALVCGIANNLAKLSLDAIIQREVPDQMRASAFGRSETLLQLAWVLGGALGIALPMDGQIGFGVAAAVLLIALAGTLAGNRGLGGGARLDRPSRVETPPGGLDNSTAHPAGDQQ
jgi:MFS family permease